MTVETAKTSGSEMRRITISLMPMFGALLAASFYLVYLKASGAEVSDFCFLETIFSTIALGSLFGLALNELLAWKAEGLFRIKRLVFRWALVGLYFLLFVGLYIILFAFLPWASTASVLTVSAVLASWILIVIALRKKNLFSRLDRA